jgi:hypothetical protein
MGDRNQFELVRRNADLVRSPILEVGSRNYGSTPDFRSLLPGSDYVGVDMSDGKGVDLVVDLTEEFSLVDVGLQRRRFNTIFCFSVLEHCTQPFQMCANLERLLQSGGSIFVGAPFSWQIHGYPSDYWRFTAAGIRLLFPHIEFDDARSRMATSEDGQLRPIDESMWRAELSVSTARRRGDYGVLRGWLVRAVRRLRLFPFIFDYRYLHPPVNVLMIGRKRVVQPHAEEPSSPPPHHDESCD